MFLNACCSCGVKVTDEVVGTNDVGVTAWEKEWVSFANSASVELSSDARIGRYPRSVFVCPPKLYRQFAREQNHSRYRE